MGRTVRRSNRHTEDQEFFIKKQRKQKNQSQRRAERKNTKQTCKEYVE